MSSTSTSRDDSSIAIIPTTPRGLFDAVVSLVRGDDNTYADDGEGAKLSDSVRLRMYGLYKRCTVGRLHPHEYDDDDDEQQHDEHDDDDRRPTARPSAFHVVACAKYDAWASCDVYTLDEARMAYVHLAAEQDHHPVGRTCRELLAKFEDRRHMKEQGGRAHDDDQGADHDGVAEEAFEDALEHLPPPPAASSPSTSSPLRPAPTTAQHERQHRKSSPEQRYDGKSTTTLLERWTGIKPLVPRGQLDISLGDLTYAILTCLWMMACNNAILPCGSYYARTDVRRRYEEDIARAWRCGTEDGADGDVNVAKDATNDASTHDEVVVGLSVRSLLDAYLTGRNYPSGSEIILAPCITIPGMVQVLQHHGVRVVPVDILPHEDNANDDDANDRGGDIGRIGVDFDAIEGAITSRTVAILITHPFGLVCTTDEDMAAIRSLADRHDLDVIEDCAECYTGRSSGQRRQDALVHSSGSSQADICFYSFGTIKTATALGGGIAIVRGDKEGLADQMRRAQLFSGQQTNAQYLAKLIKCSVLQFVSFYPPLCGLVAFVMRTFGLDYDRAATSMLRGFRQHDLIGQIRKRPCTALLALLHRRLSDSSASTTASVVSARVIRCQLLSQQLVKSCSHSVRIPRGTEGSQHCYWLFPVHVDDPRKMSKLLEREGFDAPSGASQLTSATMLDGVHGDCPMAERLVKGIIYLPAPSYPLTKSLVHRIVRVLRCENVAKGATVKARAQMMKENRLLFTTRNDFLLIGIGSVAALWVWPFCSIRGALESLLWDAFGCGMIVLVLRFFISQDYMQLSTAMSKYSVDDISSCRGSGCNTQNGCALEAAALKVPSVETTDPDDLVLLTGATGFMGSLLLRELLLHREKLGIAGVVVLCRSKGSRSPHDRMAKVLSEDMFSFLSDKERDDLVLVIEGDVTQPDVGMSRQDLLRVKNELSISLVFHCAASVSFTQSLEDAAASNITSSLQLQQLTKQLKRKHAKFVYISTAFVHGGSTGAEDSPLPEQVYRMHPYDPQALYRSMLETQSYASAAMHDLGFPNTYTFSKCICEHLLLRDMDSDTIIIRPSIVGPAVQEPREGWAGSKPSTLVAAACLYLKFPYNLWSFGKTSVPFVPVDVVCRFVLSKAFESLDKEEDERSRHHLARSDSVVGSRSISSTYTDDGSYQKVSLPTCEDISSTSSPSSSDASLSSSASRNIRNTKRIFTACWDSKSQASASFLWIDYAITITHVGVIFGYMSRLVVYLGMVFTVLLFPWLNLKLGTYRKVHSAVVISPIDFLRGFLEKLGIGSPMTRNLRLLQPFLDLPLLFFPFTNKSFYFRSEIDAPPGFDGQRYMLSCALAAEQFVRKIGNRNKVKPASSADDRNKASTSSHLVIAGASHRPMLLDSLWALSQPRGNIFVRLAGWILIKIFRLTLEELTVDISKVVCLAKAKKEAGRSCHIILAPTHRSLYDFLIISFVAFALPELGLEVPYIAAAEDFYRVPFLGWLMQYAGAFFLIRGRGTVDPELRSTVTMIKDKAVMHRRSDYSLSSIEVFIEGTRSRDRRFSRAKTGFIRCLQETGGDHIILPIAINYEAIPDQTFLSQNAEGGISRLGSGLRVRSLGKWLRDVACGRIRLGRVHVAAAEPILLADGDETSPGIIVQTIQRKQAKQTLVSSYHIEAASRVLCLEHKTVRGAIKDLGGQFWLPYDIQTPLSRNRYHGNVSIPRNNNELLTVMLHFGHLFAPLVKSTHPQWSDWLGHHLMDEGRSFANWSVEITAVKSALARLFDTADDAVNAVLKTLNDHGFDSPLEQHALRYVKEQAKGDSSSPPLLLLRAALSFRIAEERQSVGASSDFDMPDDGPVTPLFSSNSSSNHSSSFIEIDSSESFGAWGYQDSGFVAEVREDGSRAVVMKGNRYKICNVALPRLIPFLEEESQLRVDIRQVSLSPALHNPKVADSALRSGDVDKMLEIVGGDQGRVSIEAKDRARHGTGHTQEDMYLIRSGLLEQFRLPDAVIWVNSEQEVEVLVALARAEQWCLIPFGGGTNVSHATHCPTLEQEPRPIVSVDMKLMNRVLWIDETNGLAHVQAGITGADLALQMKERGFTIGHEPDSIEFSTLGGWIATKASGMKRNKYGNIEDIVRDVRVVGSMGRISQNVDHGDPTFGRVSTGIDVSSLMFGSEGNCGIITSAVINICPLPEIITHDGIVFASFEDGLRFVRDVASSSTKPASVRLLDNEQFRLGQALRKESTGFAGIAEHLTKMIATWTNSFPTDKAVCATIVYEGSADEVKCQQKQIVKLASKYGGVSTGAQIGRAGYDLTFAIAYLRDFAMSYHFLAESFETFVPWSRVEEVIVRTKKRIVQEHRKRFLPGEPIVSSRVTQLYDNGACVYFYFCMSYEGISEPSRVYGEIEAAARDEILLCGGSLSHHHGVGKLRAPFMTRVTSDHHRRSLLDVKKSIDPHDVFGVRNGMFASTDAKW